jgi:hypothetical protein
MEELRDRIFEYLQAHPKGKRKLDDIQEGLGLTSSSAFAALSKELDSMEAEYLVFRSQENQYETREQAGILEGRLSINRAGMTIRWNRSTKCLSAVSELSMVL